MLFVVWLSTEEGLNYPHPHKLVGNHCNTGIFIYKTNLQSAGQLIRLVLLCRIEFASHILDFITCIVDLKMGGGGKLPSRALSHPYSDEYSILIPLGRCFGKY